MTLFESIAGNILVTTEHGDGSQIMLVLPNGRHQPVCRGDVRSMDAKLYDARARLGKILEDFVGTLCVDVAAPTPTA